MDVALLTTHAVEKKIWALFGTSKLRAEPSAGGMGACTTKILEDG